MQSNELKAAETSTRRETTAGLLDLSKFRPDIGETPKYLVIGGGFSTEPMRVVSSLLTLNDTSLSP